MCISNTSSHNVLISRRGFCSDSSYLMELTEKKGLLPFWVVLSLKMHFAAKSLCLVGTVSKVCVHPQGESDLCAIDI